MLAGQVRQTEIERGEWGLFRTSVEMVPGDASSFTADEDTRIRVWPDISEPNGKVACNVKPMGLYRKPTGHHRLVNLLFQIKT